MEDPKVHENDCDALRPLKIPNHDLLSAIPIESFDAHHCCRVHKQSHDLFGKTIQHGEMSKQQMQKLKHPQDLDKIEVSTADPWDNASFTNKERWNVQRVTKHSHRDEKTMRSRCSRKSQTDPPLGLTCSALPHKHQLRH